MQRMCFAALIGLAAMTAAGGCSPYATYPRLDGSGQITGPAIYPVPELMAMAIMYAHDRNGSIDEMIINLPTGTPPQVYDMVIRKLGGGRPMLLQEEPAYHVESVRVRGFDAEVDVIYPQASGHYDFITISLHRGVVAEYQVTSTRVWRMRVEAPEPRYEPPPADIAEADPPRPVADVPQVIFGTPQP